MHIYMYHIDIDTYTHARQVVAHAFIPRTKEAEADEILWVRSQRGLQSKFWDTQGSTEKYCLEKPIYIYIVDVNTMSI